MIGEFTTHPAAELFPMMDGADFDALVADIKEHGQRDPITIYKGAILDGRNRYRACLQIGIEPTAIEWDGNGTPEQFVASMNLHRRHLTIGQRALIAARLATAKQGDNLRHRQEVGIPAPTLREAAKLLQVDRSTVSDAKTILEHAAPEQLKAIEAGRANIGELGRALRRERREREAATIAASPQKRAAHHPGNAARIERQRQDTVLWQNLKTAMLAVNNLPKPGDMVTLVRRWDRSNVTDQHLLRALNWLQEFADVWTRNSDQDAA